MTSFSLRRVSYRYQIAGPNGDLRGFPGIEVDELDIPSAGITAIIGPSGSGKTTLLSILAGFISARIGEGGRLELNGAPVEVAGRAPGRVAFVFQSPNLLGSATTVVNLLQGRVAADAAGRGRAPLGEARLRANLTALGLDGTEKALLGMRARDLSGGEAQRVAVLRAILTDPDAVLCDEPTSNLDDTNAHAVLVMLRCWARERGRPLVWITHNLRQAAEYADHFVFVSSGRILGLTKTDLNWLANAQRHPANMESQLRDVANRLRMAQDGAKYDPLQPPVARMFQGKAPDAAAAPPGDLASATDRPIRVSRLAYARWIANALSIGEAGGGMPASGPDQAQPPTALAPGAVRGLIDRVSSAKEVPNGRLWRLREWLRRYSLHGLIGVLIVLMVQILAAEFGGRLASAYSAQRLQDPSVARIVFEREATRRFDRPQEPAKLTPDVIRSLEAAIAGRLPEVEPGAVRVFGRRQPGQSQLRFPEAKAENCRLWQPVQTVVLDRADPLLRQTVLTRAIGSAEDPTLLLEIDAALAPHAANAAAAALLHVEPVRRLRVSCDLPTDTPIAAEWAALSSGTANGKSLRLAIVGAVDKPPPLHPYTTQMIVFEEDYAAAMTLHGARSLDPFDVAAAYFPIDGFAAAAAVLEEAGYTIRDDSAAAVQELRRIAQIARIVPPIVIILNIAGCFIVVVLMLDAILKLNKRVFALFVAHGFRLADMLTAFTLHLAPALVLAGLAIVGAAAGLWTFFGELLLPPDIGPLEPLRNRAIFWTLAYSAMAVAIATLVTTLHWWKRTRRSLKTYLQE